MNVTDAFHVVIACTAAVAIVALMGILLDSR